MITIRQLDSDDACRQREPLIDLLRDAVAGGASLGFLLPLGRAEAESYWGSVVDAVRAKRRLLLVALAHQRVIGSVQLDLETRANGRHRAEIMKLIVLSPHRRQCVGRKLMSAVLALARDARRSLLLLDMRAGSRAPNRQRPEAAWRSSTARTFNASANAASALSVKIARSIRSSRLVELLAATASASRYSSVALPKACTTASSTLGSICRAAFDFLNRRWVPREHFLRHGLLVERLDVLNRVDRLLRLQDGLPSASWTADPKEYIMVASYGCCWAPGRG